MADPVQIELTKIGKRFKSWIFRDIDLIFESSVFYGIVGHNGIGKSTLLRIISGYTSPTVGRVIYSSVHGPLDIQSAAGTVSYAAPYIDLIDELTVTEMVLFHQSFRKFFPALRQIEDILRVIELYKHRDTLVGDLSSGLMQRLKVGLMIVTESPVLLLDEPTSYLDLNGKQWYHQLLEKYRPGRLVIVASNDPDDLIRVDRFVNMEEFIPLASIKPTDPGELPGRTGFPPGSQ